MQHPVTIRTDDGHELSGIFVKPQGAPKAACVLHSATGVPKEFYLKFAQWLAEEQNVAALVYDYRDFGGSLHGSLKASAATMADWGVRDASAALDCLIAEYPNTEIWAVGHSLGGMFLNAHKQSAKISRAFGVASGANYWTQNPLSAMPVITAMWWLVGPAATGAFGYLPGKKLGLGADIPGGVYWQWRRWCLSRDFLRADLGKSIPALDARANPKRLTLIAIEDDPIITPAMVKRLGENYLGANPEYKTLAMKDIGAKKVGHIGIFREQNKKAWPLIIA
jgi:predicted alpha/beta hydrolase